MHHKCKIKTYRHFSLDYIFLLLQLNFIIYLITSCAHFKIIFIVNWLLKQIFTRNMLYPCTYILTDHLFFTLIPPTSSTPSTSNNNSNKKNASNSTSLFFYYCQGVNRRMVIRKRKDGIYVPFAFFKCHIWLTIWIEDSPLPYFSMSRFISFVKH